MPHDLIDRYHQVRQRTSTLAHPLSAEDCCVQSMPDASPVKWHLAHTTWFFETFILEAHEPQFVPFNAAFRMLFNSYYNAVGDKHPRLQRGLLTRPTLDEVLNYRRAVDQRMSALLATQAVDAKLQELVVLGLHHEQQHQELMLTDIKHLFSCSPLFAAYAAPGHSSSHPVALHWQHFEGGLFQIGYDGDGFYFDNEKPRHTVYLQPFELATRLVTNAEYAAFIASGGYTVPAYWLSEGWDWCQAQGRGHPLYWHWQGSGWSEFTLHGLVPLDDNAPVLHVSYFEAEAYARWAEARLPTEVEWECAAAPLSDCTKWAANTDLTGYHPCSAQEPGMCQLLGVAWQWTQSSYAPYPGFKTLSGAVGEYNGKFMVNQYVLRGGSCITPQNHTRISYRNFFPTFACWQFSGIRLARDVSLSSGVN
jgi:ergothioneine biosynthesis protein EgtB